MTFIQLLLYIATGILLSAVYLFLLWITVLLLPKIKYRGLFLLFSAIIRISLFLFVALFVSQKAALPFLLIVASFILTRFVVVKFVKLGGKK